MNVREKAIGLINSFPDNLFFDVDESDYRRMVDAVVIALKEQDRDTRHACADLVCGSDIVHQHFYSAIMNCRGGIE